MPASTAAQPLVTIGIPAYNSERYLAQSIESLLAQTYGDFVMVICDNASTDGTADLCQRYVQQDSRVRYFRNPVNIGMTGNFNRVFELTDTKYIKWSTADDWWAPDMLADAMEVMEADESIAVCYPRAVIVDAEGVEQDRYDDDLHLMQGDARQRFVQLLSKIRLVNHHLGLLRSSMVRQTRLFAGYVAADTGFLAELSLYGKFFNVPKYQFYRRFHVDSSSWKRGDEKHEAGRFYGAAARKRSFVSWRIHLDLVRSVLRSDLGLKDRLGLLAFLGRRMYWDQELLTQELVAGIKQTASGQQR